MIKCPVCFDYILPPIFQCENGHVVCQICRTRRCPTCQVPIENGIYATKEVLSETLGCPCQFRDNGCHLSLNHAEEDKHENQCPFIQINCPGVHCEWKGLLRQTLLHLLEVHKVAYHKSSTDIVIEANEVTKSSGAFEWLMAQHCHGRDFLVVVRRLNEQQYVAYVLFIGTKKEAGQFFYRLNLCSEQQKAAFQAATRSVAEGINAPTDHKDCFFFSQEDVESSMDGDVFEIKLVVGNIGI
ncbi:E3 ubiquitin-protein ligase Siah2-like [Cloeon dipterum]|uniref:E3 ubiquitin-protein ligase Siah2-like n=1 Tax=Cloeon dipterum TaxID=197152 RepID=UPI0032201A79